MLYAVCCLDENYEKGIVTHDLLILHRYNYSTVTPRYRGVRGLVGIKYPLRPMPI